MNTVFKYLKGDRILWIVTFFLCLFSLLAVYSSISSLAMRTRDGNTLYYLFRHGTMLVIGLAIMFYVSKIRFKYVYRLSLLLVVLAGILLVVTLLVGNDINDAKRWITIPIVNQSFQTSDLAKIALVLYVARLVTRNQENIRNFKLGVLPILAPIGIICLLILPANFSTAALLFLTCFILLFIAGVRISHMSLMVLAAVIAFSGMVALSKVAPEALPRLSTWVERIVDFKSGEGAENYQVERAKMAIISGGVMPALPGKATSRNYLPHSYSDMIYAFIIEEYGSILGGIGILFLYVVLFIRTMRIARRANSKFAGFAVIGLGFMIIFQALVNMAVAVNLIPVTGQPLPLVSMGGTSIWFTCLALGLIQCVARESQEQSVSVIKHEVAFA
ncbi:MAG: FtsW/RodA/SpoVE family cell cycle protein [Flavobacteriales bacterium]|nr:FtsW/RodA/SpoVE family cell cycle protein [Flavobacteriales bacterium]